MAHHSLIQNNLNEATTVLEQFVANSDNIDKINDAAQLMIECLKNGGKIISCGNGGSMSDAMHFAEELTGYFREDRKGYAALALSDPSYITCVGNDRGFHQIFSRQLSALGKEGDILLGISTSGNSKNIINAAFEAKNLKMKTVVLTGKNGGELANLAHVEIRAPYSQYADRAQEIHIKVIHCLIHCIEQGMA
ncbi:MAG: D-sedoheptulose 7-phosphate isomerase [Sphingobacteriales bacterium]|jgi:D-sedoheptulose 7-phosphate isomerase